MRQQVQRRRAGIDRHRVPGTDVVRHQALEFERLGAKGQATGAHDVGDGLIKTKSDADFRRCSQIKTEKSMP